MMPCLKKWEVNLTLEEFKFIYMNQEEKSTPQILTLPYEPVDSWDEFESKLKDIRKYPEQPLQEVFRRNFTPFYYLTLEAEDATDLINAFPLLEKYKKDSNIHRVLNSMQIKYSYLYNMVPDDLLQFALQELEGQDRLLTEVLPRTLPYKEYESIPYQHKSFVTNSGTDELLFGWLTFLWESYQRAVNKEDKNEEKN